MLLSVAIKTNVPDYSRLSIPIILTRVFLITDQLP